MDADEGLGVEAGLELAQRQADQVAALQRRDLGIILTPEMLTMSPTATGVIASPAG